MSESMCKRPNIHPHNATENIFAFFVFGRIVWIILLKTGPLDWSVLNIQQGLQVFGSFFFDSQRI